MAGTGVTLAAVTSAPSPRAALIPLFRELGHLKRITSAGRQGSIATRLFLSAWGALTALSPFPARSSRAKSRDVGMGQADARLSTSLEMNGVSKVAFQTVAAAAAAARLGDLDRAQLLALGLSVDDSARVLNRAFDEASAAIDPDLAAALRPALGDELADGAVPVFATLLAEQPRAGVTCPGKPRLILGPAENHAEHSLIVAVYGVLLAPSYAADPARVFLAGLGHHLHSAAMPDSGFTGEVLLGELLDGVIAEARARALGELAPDLRAAVADALAAIADDRTPEGRAFHAADVIDRVLEIEQQVAAAGATMDTVLRDYELVHAGPVKRFHDATLREVGLQ